MSTTALGDSHEASLYRTLVKHQANYAIFRILPDGVVGSWNSGVESLLGYAEHEFVGQPFEALFTPEDRAEGVPSREMDLARDNGWASDERWHLRKDGSRLFVDGMVAPVFHESGHIASFTKIMRDATARKITQERQQQLTNRLTEQAHALDLTNTVIRQFDGEITTWTGGAASFYGWSSDEAQGRCAHELLRTRFPQPLAVIEQHLIDHGEWQGELTQTTKEGLDVTVISRWVLHYERGRNNRRVIEGVVDVSELKRLHRSMLQANAELSTFAYSIAHDIQSPLRAMSLAAQLLARREDASDSLKASLSDSIVDGSRKLGQLVESLLLYATFDGRRAEPTPVSLADVAASVVANLAGVISAAAAEVTWDDLPVVLGYAPRLVQLLQNLIGNAVKYCRPDLPPRVHLSSERLGDQWLVHVADNGMGIDPQFALSVFAPLRRLHGDSIPGTGLGLAICKRIVESEGGRIWVTSLGAEGSVFHFTVPSA